MSRRPNSGEQHLINLFSEHCLPIRYAGDGQFFVGRKNPDFIMIDGAGLFAGKVIELNGRFYHRNDDGSKERFYKEQGIDCLTLWWSEHEEFDDEDILKQVMTFLAT